MVAAKKTKTKAKKVAGKTVATKIVAKNKVELRKLMLETRSFAAKLSRDEVGAFIAGVKFTRGVVAHMMFKDIEPALSTSQFKQLLGWMSITPKMFSSWKDYTCSGDSGYWHCIVKQGYYCDPERCSKTGH